MQCTCYIPTVNESGAKEILGKLRSSLSDDIIIYSWTFKEHKQHVEQVFKALREANLIIKPKKCEFAK